MVRVVEVIRVVEVVRVVEEVWVVEVIRVVEVVWVVELVWSGLFLRSKMSQQEEQHPFYTLYDHAASGW